MKTRYIFGLLLALYLCAILPVRAFEYFVIHYTDGTESQPFYTSDVLGIVHSKTDLDGIEHEDWQVQEIVMTDTTYRIPIALIDHVSFMEVDENVLAKDMARASAHINPIYMACNSTQEIASYLPEISKIQGVEKAWTDHQSLFVKIRNGYTITYSYPPHAESPSSAAIPQLLQTSLQAPLAQSSTASNVLKNPKVCLYNQLYNNEDRNSERTITKKFEDMCRKCGITPTIHNGDLTPTFFKDEIFSYDLVFLITHGFYNSEDDIHWLLTNEELLAVDGTALKDSVFLESVAEGFVDRAHEDRSPAKITWSYQKEKRKGKYCLVLYTAVSETYIGSADTSFPNKGKAVVFNAACQSLMTTGGMAIAFHNRGAGNYLGYTESNSVGADAGLSFFESLLSGQSVKGAFECVPDEEVEEEWEGIVALLGNIPQNEQSKKLFVTPIETKSLGHVTIDGTECMQLKATQKVYDKNHAPKTYGFLVGSTEDMADAKEYKAKATYDDATQEMCIEYTFTPDQSAELDHFYYRAYSNDGFYDNFGNIRSNVQEAYAVLKDSILTFYYDYKEGEREGAVYSIPERRPEESSREYKERIYWGSYSTHILDFDDSFADYRPTCTAFWFYLMKNLKSINNLQNLNTSQVTDMTGMFYYCKSLTSLDLSSFDTSKVERMSDGWFGMFTDCESLSNLDLSSFDTSQVTDMSYMFCGCSSLTSLDLSSFDTSHVKDMDRMFMRCKSLTNLNLSNFDTSQVTNMEFMFGSCSSLTSLDLNNFDTSQVTNMGSMFIACSSLKHIYAHDFNFHPSCSNSLMFNQCDNLVGGQGTHIGYNIYGYDKNGKALYYYCDGNWHNARIDGGKDRPGLFTAK